MTTLQAALKAAVVQLQDSDSAELDAQLLMAQVLGKNRSWLYAWPDHQLTASQQQQFETLVQRRHDGEPIAYLCGKRAFWNIELKVTPAVLIPRPETELLVELALQLAPASPGLIADLGTGSGAIALALAGEYPHWQVHATEKSTAAAEVAMLNIRESGVQNLQLFTGSWCEPLPAHNYHLLLSNPPYIDGADPHLQQGDVRFEPRSALVANDEGLADLRQIAAQATSRLATDGWLLLEHGWQQGEAVRRILAEHGYRDVSTRQDHGSRDRVTLGRWPGTSV